MRLLHRHKAVYILRYQVRAGIWHFLHVVVYLSVCVDGLLLAMVVGLESRTPPCVLKASVRQSIGGKSTKSIVGSCKFNVDTQITDTHAYYQ